MVRRTFQVDKSEEAHIFKFFAWKRSMELRLLIETAVMTIITFVYQYEIV